MTVSNYCITGELICPLYDYCIARKNDPTIAGCGMCLFLAGVIAWNDVGVIHQIKGVNDETKILQQ
jgi:hypothetical protein